MGFWADRKARKKRERAERAERAARAYLAGTGNVNPYGLVDPNLAILTVLAQQENTPEPMKDEDMDTTPYDSGSSDGSDS